VAPQHGTRRTDRAEQAQRRTQRRRQSLAAQAADAERFERDVVLRYQGRLQAAVRAEPQNGHIARTEFGRDRESREDVAAGTAGHDQDRTLRVGERSRHRAPPVSVRTSTSWRSAIACIIAFSARLTS